MSPYETSCQNWIPFISNNFKSRKESFRYLNFSVRSHFSVQPSPRKHIRSCNKTQQERLTKWIICPEFFSCHHPNTPTNTHCCLALEMIASVSKLAYVCLDYMEDFSKTFSCWATPQPEVQRNCRWTFQPCCLSLPKVANRASDKTCK